MKRAGRISWVLLIGVVGILVVVGILMVAQESPTTAATRFMTALTKGDVKTLTELTYLDDATEKDPAGIKKQWEFSTDVGKYYTFIWKITGETASGPDAASVKMTIIKNAASPAAYDEPCDLPMVKVKGRWKVNVRSMWRELYPALPR